MPTPYDPAYIPIANAVMPPVAQQFTAGAGGIMPGTPGSTGLIPPMPQMTMPGLSPYSPAIAGTPGSTGLIPPMPQMTMPGLSPYSPAIPGTQSMMPAPIGGQWNQLAQQMAGPMFMPPHPGAGIPYPNPVMPGGGPIATVAAPKPPAHPVAPPMPMPISVPSGGGAFGGGGRAGLVGVGGGVDRLHPSFRL